MSDHLKLPVDESRYNLGLAKLRAMTFLMERAAESQLDDDVELGTFSDITVILQEALTDIAAAVQQSKAVR